MYESAVFEFDRITREGCTCITTLKYPIALQGQTSFQSDLSLLTLCCTVPQKGSFVQASLNAPFFHGLALQFIVNNFCMHCTYCVHVACRLFIGKYCQTALQTVICIQLSSRLTCTLVYKRDYFVDIAALFVTNRQN